MLTIGSPNMFDELKKLHENITNNTDSSAIGAQINNSMNKDINQTIDYINSMENDSAPYCAEWAGQKLVYSHKDWIEQNPEKFAKLFELGTRLENGASGHLFNTVNRDYPEWCDNNVELLMNSWQRFDGSGTNTRFGDSLVEKGIMYEYDKKYPEHFEKKTARYSDALKSEMIDKWRPQEFINDLEQSSPTDKSKTSGLEYFDYALSSYTTGNLNLKLAAQQKPETFKKLIGGAWEECQTSEEKTTLLDKLVDKYKNLKIEGNEEAAKPLQESLLTLYENSNLAKNHLAEQLGTKTAENNKKAEEKEKKNFFSKVSHIFKKKQY